MVEKQFFEKDNKFKKFISSQHFVKHFVSETKFFTYLKQTFKRCFQLLYFLEPKISEKLYFLYDLYI